MAAPATAADPAAKFRLIQRSPLASPPSPVPTVPAEASAALRWIAQHGLKARPYDQAITVTAPNGIGATPESYSPNGAWDAWYVTPTVSAYLAFDEEQPDANAVPLTANVEVAFPVRASKISYLAASASTGVLRLRLFRWADP